ncbi:MAG: class I adenylate-forming enzyme family protein [Alphaproteobacteria bacterium]
MSDLTTAVAYPAEMAAQYRAAGYWTDETPQQWLAHWAAKQPAALAGIGAGPPLTYGSLYDQARRVAAGLLKLGFRKGDAIGIQLPNSPELMIAFHGIQLMGGVVCMLHMPYREMELAPMLKHAGARAVFCHNALESYDAAACMLSLAKSVPSLETVIVAVGEAPPGTVAFADLVAGEPVEIADPPQAADPAVIAFTSGTTASPKAVVHPHYTLAASARISVGDTGWTSRDVVLCAPAFTHAFGLTVMLAVLNAGAAAALMAAYTPPALAETIKSTKATSLCCGPAHVFANARAGLLGQGITDTIRSAFVGGAHCPPQAIQTLQDACPNGTIYQIWGMTEVLMGVINPLDAPLDLRLRSIGTPPAGHDLRVVGDDDTVLGVDREGELQIRGPFLFRGYYNNEEASRLAFTDDGWFRTGDIARIDSDGNVYMTGRTKDIINRGGIKINPVDIELMLEEHPSVMQAAIIPYPHDILGERACLVIVPRPGQSMSIGQMQDYLTSRGVAKIRWPERIETVQAMPMTPTRKIIKGKLAQQVLNKSPATGLK